MMDVDDVAAAPGAVAGSDACFLSQLAAASTSNAAAQQQAQQRHATTPTKASPSGAGAGSPSFWSARTRVAYSDRCIPSRAVAARLDFSVLDRELATGDATRMAASREDLNPAYDMLLRSEMLGLPPCPVPASPDKAGQSAHLQPESPMRVPCSPSKQLFRFKSGDAQSPLGGPAPASPFSRSALGDDGGASPLASPKQAARKIPRAPFKVLDAPALQDDFYLNLVDWSAQNVLAVGLGACVYLWSAQTGQVTQLCELAPPDSVSSVAWSQRGAYLSVGTQSGKVQVWDPTRKEAPLRTMEGHKGRVGTQAWSSHLLSSGSRDRTILHRDVRAREPFVGKLLGHRSEVCGLKWSPDSTHLASGGNDNNLFVWSAGSSQPLFRFADHVAAVKAIAWSPHQHGLLASGGGTADRCIRFWNTSSGSALNCIDTGSQVCNLAWSKNVNEIVSTHGYSQNQVVVWRYPTMTKLATLTGHSLRVLYLAASPDGQTIVTGAGDETLRFWSVFPSARPQGSETSMASMPRTTIR